MTLKTAKTAAIALAVPCLAFATPGSAASVPTLAAPSASHTQFVTFQSETVAEHHRGRDHRYKRGRGHYRDQYRGDYGYQGQPVYRDTRIWRGRDGRYYCRKENGTTGLLIGAAVGGLIGNEVAGRGDRTLGAILGAAGGAILGRAIDRSNSRCR
ncbi:glycine zipper 2TM domain-containing protein [Pontixanthobacter aestiaquae]|uniref:17 kDa surface antigen n=1 Tax=Pontixanthobacter aestiaquae TaxID=1509367 RepID=A0A844Z8N2_9SPHN|nr:glycine zipper 2TM domain-containing protein [Pontixanthobacter aestiaquae]MDN3645815.1 glycine zipper 2TM domain-containing protein [Pontixanthobacter aestiaquae]MXO83190.1 glycine zipper 2TM domain-containing protein [Pontixanthobacter aestiaquae]